MHASHLDPDPPLRTLVDVIAAVDPTAAPAAWHSSLPAADVDQPALRAYNAIGRFDDAEAGRHAAIALELDGLDGACITLLRVRVAGGKELHSADDNSRLLHDLGVTGIVGMVAGGLVGTLLGLLAVTALAWLDVAAAAALILAGMSMGAIVGSLTSLLCHLAVVRSLQSSLPVDRAEATVVAAHVDDFETAERLEAVLEQSHATQTCVLDQSGALLPRAP